MIGCEQLVRLLWLCMADQNALADKPGMPWSISGNISIWPVLRWHGISLGCTC